MGDRDSALVSRRLVVVLGLLLAGGAALVAVLGFLVPHRRILRNFEPGTCTVESAKVGCSNECRIVNVSSAEFPKQGVEEPFARVVLDGIGSAPCATKAECDETFACRYRVTTAPTGTSTSASTSSAEDGAKVILAREDITEFPVGFALFMGIACFIVFVLVTSLAIDAGWRGCQGFDDDGRVHAVVFLPPPVDLAAFSNATHKRWPSVESRAFDFRNELPFDMSRGPSNKLRDAFRIQIPQGKQGVIFMVRANGRNDADVLESVPVEFERLCLLPSLESLLDQLDDARDTTTSHSDIEHGVTQSAAQSTVNANAAENVPVTGDFSGSKSYRRPSEYERDVLEVRAAYHSLSRMSDDEQLFDYVYDEFDLNDDVRYPRLVVRVLGPVVGFRISFVSGVMRIHQAVADGFSSGLARVMRSSHRAMI